jgi:F420-dependent oxidoreductase-like protein
MLFGFKTTPQNTTWPDMLAVWREADDIPVFSYGWTSDHFFPVHTTDLSVSRLEGWTTLAALAAATRRLRFGTLVTGINYRHPAVLACMAATLDVMSGGRCELAVGAGWYEAETSAYGIPLGGPGERSDRFEEGCAVLTGLLTLPADGLFDFSGRYYTLRGAICNPRPVQAPLPLCVGGNGEERTLRTAARFAQHWNCDAGGFARGREVLHQHCADIGRDPASIMLSAQVRFEGDYGAVAGAAFELGSAGADLVNVYLPPRHTPAVLEPLASALAQVASLPPQPLVAPAD